MGFWGSGMKLGGKMGGVVVRVVLWWCFVRHVVML